METRALLRFQNTINCCYLSSDVSGNTLIFFLSLPPARPEEDKSLTDFSADKGVAAFKPLSPGSTN